MRYEHAFVRGAEAHDVAAVNPLSGAFALLYAPEWLGHQVRDVLGRALAELPADQALLTVHHALLSARTPAAVTVATVDPDPARVVVDHCGDVRVWRIASGVPELLVRPHVLGEQRADLEPAVARFRTRAVGYGDLSYESHGADFAPGDILVLANCWAADLGVDAIAAAFWYGDDLDRAANELVARTDGLGAVLAVRYGR